MALLEERLFLYKASHDAHPAGAAILRAPGYVFKCCAAQWILYPSTLRIFSSYFFFSLPGPLFCTPPIPTSINMFGSVIVRLMKKCQCMRGCIVLLPGEAAPISPPSFQLHFTPWPVGIVTVYTYLCRGYAGKVLDWYLKHRRRCGHKGVFKGWRSLWNIWAFSIIHFNKITHTNTHVICTFRLIAVLMILIKGDLHHWKC